ncbi:Rieske 2Fe-2S domain-containing protein [Nocardia sp. NPDC051463]|uniref:Rieske 2Fe-2S domain-containing protein n=1 Tax=Nocardia sp. NPDC051463 TaxID=3154845 RepID=UPI00343A4531
MKREHNSLAARLPAPTPPAYPQGWYAVGFSRELRAGRVLTRRFMDREIVLFRTGRGRAAAAEAYCPHLGAHLSRGGVVAGENLRCPFHGFEFDAEGSCTATPYGSPPPAARLGLLPLREVCGALLVFHDPRGAAPAWEVIAPDQLDREWWPVRYATLRHRGHPQEVTENSVDLGHLTVDTHRHPATRGTGRPTAGRARTGATTGISGSMLPRNDSAQPGDIAGPRADGAAAHRT